MKGSEQDAAPLGIAHHRHRRRVLPWEEIEILAITCWVVRAEGRCGLEKMRWTIPRLYWYRFRNYDYNLFFILGDKKITPSYKF